jgi:hypothetical protein
MVSAGLGYLAIAKPRIEFEFIQEPGMGATESPNDILIGIHVETTDMVGGIPASELFLDQFTFTLNSPNGTNYCTYNIESSECRIVPEYCVQPTDFSPNSLELKKGDCFPGIVPSITQGPFVILETGFNICEMTCTIQMDIGLNGLANSNTESIQSSISILDTDQDSCSDFVDFFPLDSLECVDSDFDGVGDNTDAFPNDSNETMDSDNDGFGDNSDWWDEGDGMMRIYISRIYAFDRNFNEFNDEYSDPFANGMYPDWTVAFVVDIGCDGYLDDDPADFYWGNDQNPAKGNTKSHNLTFQNIENGFEWNIPEATDSICVGTVAADIDKQTSGWFFPSTTYSQEILDIWDGEGATGVMEMNLHGVSDVNKLSFSGNDGDTSTMDAQVIITVQVYGN